MSRRKTPKAKGSTLPEWPLDKTPPCTVAKQTFGDDRRPRQARSHQELLCYIDPPTMQHIPHKLWREQAPHLLYPEALFPDIHMSTVPTYVALFKADEIYAGVRMRLDTEHCYVIYQGFNVPPEVGADWDNREPDLRYVTVGESCTWFTLDKDQRSIMQQLTGGILLANQGVDIGQPDLPAIGNHEIVVSSSMWTLRKYPDVVTKENQLPYLQVVHRDDSITSFVGYMATNDQEARKALGRGLIRDATLMSAIDISIVSGRDPAIEAFIGDAVARTLLLDNILPTISPSEYLA